MNAPDADETVYLALNRANFAELTEATRNYLDSNADPEALLRRWLSIQAASTELAVTPGSTKDSQAEITGLLKAIEKLQHLVEGPETRHVTWTGPDGATIHPTWCRECRVTRIMNGVQLALAELRKHTDRPQWESQPETANICRRVERYLTSFNQQPGPVEPENVGLSEIRALIGSRVKVGKGYDDKYPWIPTIEAVHELLGVMDAMDRTIKRRGAWRLAAERKLAMLGHPMTDADRKKYSS
jgi:hypothetical protein